MDSMEWFRQGGPVMYALLICSLAAAVIGIERFLFYRRAAAGSRKLMEEMPELLKKPWDEADGLCRGNTSAPAFVACAGIQAASAGEDAVLALDNAYGTAAAELRGRLNYLSMIVTLAPLLGLLGTISGMIGSFRIFNLQAGQPLAITGGIGEALIATATGLCVAIFALVLHTYFSQRMDDLLTAMDKTEAAVLSAVRRRAGDSHAA